MCFYFRQTKEALEVAKRFKINLLDEDLVVKSSLINGFTHPECSVITDSEPDRINNFEWGLVPLNSDRSIQKYTLNARVETVHEKRSFKALLNSRCLVIADGFYEWKESVTKSRVTKERYLISLPDSSLFAFAGLYSCWKSISDDKQISSFTILTTQANEAVSSVHKRNRMPVILHEGDELDWLDGKNYREFAFPYSRELTISADPVAVQSNSKRARHDSDRTLF